MNKIADACLSLAGILFISWLALPKYRSRLLRAILLSLTVYILSSASYTLITSIQSPQVEIMNNLERLEMIIRVGSAWEKSMPKPATSAATKKPYPYKAYYLQEALKTLNHASSDNATLTAYRVIDLHLLKDEDDASDALKLLNESEEENGSALASDLKLAFSLPSRSEHLDGTDVRNSQVQTATADKVIADLKQRLPQSSFRNFAIEELYRKSKQTARLSSFEADMQKRDAFFLKGIFAIGILNALGILAGAVIIVWELIKNCRRNKIAQSEKPEVITDGVRYNSKAVFGTVIAFLATKFLLRRIFGWDDFYNPHINAENALGASTMFGLIYSVTNGISLLFAYLFVLRPNQVRFAEGISLRLRFGNVGPMKMLGIGIMTLFATMTLSTISSALSGLIGLNGSSNPILPVINQIAQAKDPRAVSILFGQFILVVPFIEEGFVRGFLYTALRQRMSAFRSIAISAAFFAALHLDLPGFFTLFTTGAVFAYVVERTKSTFPTMFAHGLLLTGMLITSLLFCL